VVGEDVVQMVVEALVDPRRDGGPGIYGWEIERYLESVTRQVRTGIWPSDLLILFQSAGSVLRLGEERGRQVQQWLWKVRIMSWNE
jgi:hypothetical protein